VTVHDPDPVAAKPDEPDRAKPPDGWLECRSAMDGFVRRGFGSLPLRCSGETPAFLGNRTSPDIMWLTRAAEAIC
jgi:hypothetical protein